MRGKCIVALFLLVLVLSAVKCVDAAVIIHEILFDPPDGLLGDSNRDGRRSSKEDEFLELFNTGNSIVDISNWHISDPLSIRHVFNDNSFIYPMSTFVVFGGGSPSFSSFDWQIASTENLSLNNNGDVVSLYDIDGVLVDQVEYGSGSGKDQSIVRSIEGMKSEWVDHLELKNSQGGLYSAGYLVNDVGLAKTTKTLVPEPATMFAILFGLTGLCFARSKN